MPPKLLILPSSLGCCILFLALSRARGQGLPDPHVNHTDPIPGHAICENTCLGEAADGDNDSNNTVWLSDGICDDGGPGAYYTGCDWGTDCDDCDPRDGGFIHPPSAQPIAPRELPQPSCRLRRLLCRGAQLRGRVRRGQYNLSMPDSSFGMRGRWTPEVGALMILSHAPGRLVNVTSRVSVSNLLDRGVTPSEAQELNLFNVSLVEDTGERLDPGTGVIVCVGALWKPLLPALPPSRRPHPTTHPLLPSPSPRAPSAAPRHELPACILTCASPVAPRRVQCPLSAPLAITGASAASGRVCRAFPLPRKRALLAARRDR